MKFIISNIWLVLAAIVSGVVLVWPWISKRLSGAKEAGPMEAVQLINRRDALVLDVREQGEYNTGHVAHSRNIPVSALDKRVGEITKFKSKPVVVVCASGARSHGVSAALGKNGFTEVYVLAGGINAWQQANLPLEKS